MLQKDASEASNMATCSACDLVEEATAENVAWQDPNSQAEDISDWVEINISSSASEVCELLDPAAPLNLMNLKLFKFQTPIVYYLTSKRLLKCLRIFIPIRCL